MTLPDTSVFQALGGIFSALVSAAALIVSWFTRRASAKRKEMTALQTRINDIEKKTRELEIRAHYAPNSTDLKDIYEKLNHMDTELAKLSGISSGITSLVSLLNNHLLEKDK